MHVYYHFSLSRKSFHCLFFFSFYCLRHQLKKKTFSHIKSKYNKIPTATFTWGEIVSLLVLVRTLLYVQKNSS